MKKILSILGKKTVYLLVLIAVTIFGFGMFNFVTMAIIDPIPESLHLKVLPSDVIGYRVGKDLRREGDVMTDYGDIISYAYRGEIQPMLDGEMFRTNFGEFYKKGVNNNGEEWQAKIYTGYTYDKKGNNWYIVEHATTTVGAFNQQIGQRERKSILAYQFTNMVYADSLNNEFSGAGDGTVRVNDTSWINAHDATSGDSADSTASQHYIVSQWTGSAANIYRGFFPIPGTDQLPDTAVVTAADFNLYVDSKSDPDDDAYDYISIVGPTSQNATTTLVVDDYDNCGSTHSPTEWTTDIALNNISTGAYNSWNFNASGISNISVATTTKLGMREGHDINDSSPDAGEEFNIYFRLLEYAGTSYDPYLDVTYTVSPATGMKARKDSDQSVINTVNLQNDNELKVGLISANTSYIIDGVIFASADSVAPDIKIGFALSSPLGTIIDLAYVADDSGDAGVFESSGGESPEITLKAGGKEIIQIIGTVKTGSSGSTLQLQWAQNNSSSASTTVQAGSYLRAEAI
ncbi:MAG: hypothetical protein NUV64_00525 [Parcubacteria group bacterium]|nr:hypothetical protein [Parcubacteria group bacterium]MCR4342531.1 hypothetical protein [Patescibacteria group bacterium]